MTVVHCVHEWRKRIEHKPQQEARRSPWIPEEGKLRLRHSCAVHDPQQRKSKASPAQHSKYQPPERIDLPWPISSGGSRAGGELEDAGGLDIPVNQADGGRRFPGQEQIIVLSGQSQPRGEDGFHDIKWQQSAERTGGGRGGPLAGEQSRWEVS